MEDRSPFLPNESEFKAPQTEELEENTDKKESKKKKNKFAELLAKLLPKKQDGENETAEEDGEKQSFLEKIAGRFGFLGIEKEEIPEQTDDSEEEQAEEYTRANFLYAPINVEIDDGEAVESSADNTDQPTQAPNEHREPAQAIELHLDNETASLVSESEFPQVDAMDEEELLTDETMAPVVTHESSGVYTEAKAIIPPSAEVQAQTNKERHTETVIENRGGSGAALLGFVAAETLSRSPDAKIRKEAEHLKQQVDQLEKKQDQQEDELQRARSHNREQLENLRNKRIEDAERPPEKKMHIDGANAKKTPQRPEKAPERQENTVRSAVEQNSSDIAQKAVEKPHTAEVADSSRLLYEQVEKAAQQDVALEGFYERRHEVKDVPTLTSQSQGASGAGGGAYADGTKPNTSQQDYQIPPKQMKLMNQKPAQKKQSLYKDAITQGAAAGLALILVLALVALIWSLL